MDTECDGMVEHDIAIQTGDGHLFQVLWTEPDRFLRGPNSRMRSLISQHYLRFDEYAGAHMWVKVYDLIAW